jgi:hypothetical protein
MAVYMSDKICVLAEAGYMSEKIDVLAEEGGYYLFGEYIRMWYSEYENNESDTLQKNLSICEFTPDGRRTYRGITMELDDWSKLLENIPIINELITKYVDHMWARTAPESTSPISLNKKKTKQVEVLFDGILSVDLRTFHTHVFDEDEGLVCQALAEGFTFDPAEWGHLVKVLPAILAFLSNY